MKRPFLIRHISTVGLTLARRQAIARHWILMRTNARWN